MVNDVSIAPQEKSQPVGARIDPRESIKEEATSSVGFDTAPKANESHSSLRRSQTPLVEPPNSKQFQAIGGQDSRALPPEAAGETEKILSDTVPIHNASGHQASIAEHMNSTIDTIENEIEQPDGPDAVLPFTPTKNVLKDAEPRLPSTPSQLGLEAPPSPPKGLPSNIPKQKLDRKKRSKLKSSTLKPVAPSTAMKPVQTPYVSGLGPRILVTPTQQSKMTQSKGRVNDADRLYVMLGSAIFSLELTRYLELHQIRIHLLTSHEGHHLFRNALLYSFLSPDLQFQIQTRLVKISTGKKKQEPSISTQQKILFLPQHRTIQLYSTKT